MPGDITYFRKYIIFKNDYTNIGNINPKGHGRIEIKGNKGTVRINLENCEVEEQYRIYLLKEEKGVVEELDLGRILTDERGRGRTDINISYREWEAKGFSVKNLDAIVIRRDGNILLSAYIDKEKEAIGSYISSIGKMEEKYIEEDIQVEEELELESHEEFPLEEVEVAEEPMEEIEDVEEPLKSEMEDEYEPMTEEIENMETQEPEEVELSEYFPVSPDYGVVDEEEKSFEAIEDMEVEEVEREEVLEPDLQEFQEAEELEEAEIYEEPMEPIQQEFYQGQYRHQYDHYQSLEYMKRLNNKNQMTNYILNILKFFPQVQPLKIYLHGYTWWRIDDDGSDSNRGFLPYYNYLFSTDYKYPFLHNATTCMNQIMKYGHYLFGLYREGNDTKYYVYAIPGRFTIEEHPFKGITGFNTWYESIDGIGYWILYIDPMTGKTIYPINPMVPTE